MIVSSILIFLWFVSVNLIENTEFLVFVILVKLIEMTSLPESSELETNGDKKLASH